MTDLLKQLPLKISAAVSDLPDNIKNTVEEIRLRSGGKICVMSANGPLFLKIVLSQYDIAETVRMLCNSSVYAHTDELNQGYISLKGGHRAGVVGNFSGDNLYEFSSVNIRVAREMFGAATFLTEELTTGGVLIAGPPGSGKTTVLRDLVRQLSYRNFKVSVVDTRGEISAFSSGCIYNDLGPNTDVLFGIQKERGIEIALRTMSPQYIAFDEIGTEKELNRVFDSVNGGAAVLTTAHIGNREELMSRKVTRQLILSGAVNTVAILNNENRDKGMVLGAQELINAVHS